MEPETECNEISHNDFQWLKRRHETTGFREGLAAGQEFIMQEAFSQGLRVAVGHHCNAGKTRGALSALLFYLKARQKSSESLLSELQDIITQLEDIEDKQILCLGEPNSDDPVSRTAASSSADFRLTLDQISGGMKDLATSSSEDQRRVEGYTARKADTCATDVINDITPGTMRDAERETSIRHLSNRLCDDSGSHCTIKVPDVWAPLENIWKRIMHLLDCTGEAQVINALKQIKGFCLNSE